MYIVQQQLSSLDMLKTESRDVTFILIEQKQIYEYAYIIMGATSPCPMYYRVITKTVFLMVI